MDHERWLAPLSGAIAVGTAVAVVGVYAFGGSLSPDHETTVVTHVPVPPQEAWALLSEPARRTEWAPGVAQIVKVEDVDGLPTWREANASEDRFDFSVVSATFPTFEMRVAQPEEIGMTGGWTWTLAPDGAGTEVAVTERGHIDNLLFRGVWALKTGPWVSIEHDAAAFSRALGGDGRTTRRP